MSFVRIRPLLAAALFAAGSAHASTTLVSEGFDSVATLASHGWVLNNLNAPPSLPWFQGETFLMPAHSNDTYIASNFNAAPAGGTLSNWLVTPEFSTAHAGTVSFWLRGANDAGFSDSVRFGLSDGSSDPAAFVLGAVVTAPGDWTMYTVSFAAGAADSTARFGFEYTGSADLADYVGIDDVSISAVPEPSSWLMLGLGLLGLTRLSRRSAR